LAPDGSQGRRILRKMCLPAIEVSSCERKAPRRSASSLGSGFHVLGGSCAPWRCAMSAAAAVLPFVWAVGPIRVAPQEPIEVPQRLAQPEVAFYRKYTEAMLRRYVRLSMEAGKVPSLLGQEMFRGRVTSYRVENFDDVVIFVHDVEKCLEKLDEEQQRLISRIALQQYTLGETAGLMGLKPRTVVRRYGQAVDSLTRVLLHVKMLEPLKCCQGGGSAN